MALNRHNFNLEIDRRGTDATKYEELAEKFGRDDLLPLWIADMDFAVSPCIIEAMKRRLEHPVLGYTTAPREFWDSITGWLSHRHGWEVERDEIDFVPGVKKGLGLCINYFTRPGDKVLIQPPVYHSFKSVVEGNGRSVVTNPLKVSAEGYEMDLDGLERAIATHRPAMMIICNPHNPIGLQWDAATLRRVAEICHSNRMVLISDEIYGDMVLGSLRHIPTASVSAAAAEVTVTLGAPSKTFNIPGLASAWTVVKSPRLREGFFKWLESSEFDTPPLSAVTATTAAYTMCEKWLDDALSYIHDNVDFTIDFIERRMPQVRPVRPDAGFGLWLDFRRLGLSHNGLMELLVDKAKVALSDGATFGDEGSGFMRLNVGVPRSVLAMALDKISEAIADVNTDTCTNADTFGTSNNG